MSTMTLDRPATLAAHDEDELREVHLQQLGRIFESKPGRERASASHAYAAALDRLAVEARAIRNAEVNRLSETGVGPTEIGRLLGVTRGRGDQIQREAAAPDRMAKNEHIIARLRRQLATRGRED